MKPSNPNIAEEVQNLENVVFVCFGVPKGDELPQVATRDDVVVDILHDATGKSLNLLDAEIHNQTDPSYQ